MTTVGNPVVRRAGTLVAALIGAYLLYLAAHPESSTTTAFISFLAVIAFFVGVLAVLQPFYRPGRDQTSDDEVAPAHEWKVARFLRRARDAAPFYLGIRLFLGYEWISSARGKLGEPAWMQTGEALRAYWERAAQVPGPPARPAIVYPAYRSFIQYVLDSDWYTSFAKLVAIGELLIGIGLLVGSITVIAEPAPQGAARPPGTRSSRQSRRSLLAAFATWRPASRSRPATRHCRVCASC